jgi:hypothetical protein
MTDLAAHFICYQNMLLQLSGLSKCGLSEEESLEPGIVTMFFCNLDIQEC